MKHFDLGDGWTASIQRTTSGYFKVVVNDSHESWETMHSTELEALREILSYCEEDER